MTGYDREEVMGKTLRIFQGAWTEEAVLERLRSALSAGERFEGETYNYRKNGEAFLLNWSVDPMTDDDGKVTHFISIQREVTKKRDRQRRQKNLEKVITIQRNMISGSHDLQRVRQKVVEAAIEITGADAAVVEEAEGHGWL